MIVVSQFFNRLLLRLVIYFYYSKRNKLGMLILRDHVKGGALTEVTFFILLVLCEPKHGYAIMQSIETETDGRLTLGAGTLYGALKTLHSKGWIEPFGDEAGRKKKYIITESGKEVAKRELERLETLVKTAHKFLGGNVYD